VLSTEHKQFFADNIYAIDGVGSTGSGTIEVYNTTLGGAVLTWTPALNTFFSGVSGIVAVVGTVARISDNLFCDNTQLTSQLQQQAQQLHQQQVQRRQAQRQFRVCCNSTSND
jgi:hypothetical protein